MTPRGGHLTTSGDAGAAGVGVKVADLRRLPKPVTGVWQWQQHGACRGADPEVFFHPELERGLRKEARDRAARAVCATCPVWAVCRRHGLTVREPYGVWGGLSEDDRALIWTGTPIGDLHLPGFDPTP